MTASVAFYSPAMCSSLERSCHAWHGLLKRGEPWRQNLHRGRRRVADVQLAVFAASQSADFFHKFVGALQQLAHFFQKKFSLCRQRHASRTSTQEVRADFIL